MINIFSSSIMKNLGAETCVRLRLTRPKICQILQDVVEFKGGVGYLERGP